MINKRLLVSAAALIAIPCSSAMAGDYYTCGISEKIVELIQNQLAIVVNLPEDTWSRAPRASAPAPIEVSSGGASHG